MSAHQHLLVQDRDPSAPSSTVGEIGRRMVGCLALIVLCFAPGSGLAAADGSTEEASADVPWFEDLTASAGVDQPHETRRFDNPYAHIMEGYTALGASASVADYDLDGYEDVFFTRSSAGGKNLLYRNRGDLTFEEVGELVGVADGNDRRNASADSLWFDLEGDGDPDLLVVRFGQNLLYENLAEQRESPSDPVRFVDITRRAGLEGRFNCIVAIAFDHDLDGDLDLFLGNYFAPVDLFDPKTPRFFPESFETATNGGGMTVLRNNGDKTFTDVTRAVGIDISGWTLDLGHADADHDGDDDLYVAADFGTDKFFRNNGDGTFADVSLDAIGIDTKKGMNVDWGDFDGDGLFDIYVTNITDEYMKEGNFLWQNLGDLRFADVARETGTHATGWGWAGKFFDYDNDGWQDLYVVNGWVSGSPDPQDNYVLDIFQVIVDPEVDLADARNWPPMGTKTLSGYQRNRLFHNRGGLFRDEGPRHGLDTIEDARGVAVADFDHDGRLDLFVTNSGRDPYLWRNIQPTDHHWLQLDLVATASEPSAIGARVWVHAGDRVQVAFVNGGNGFASQSTRIVHIGLGNADTIERVEVAWPSGRRQQVESLAVDRRYRWREGEVRPRPLRPDAATGESTAHEPKTDSPR